MRKGIKSKLRRAICRAIIISQLLAYSITPTSAQGDGLAGITAATSMVNSFFEPLTQLMYSAGAVTGLIGGYKLYNKMCGGDADSYKYMGAFLGSCVVLVIVPTLLRAFFM